MLLLCIQERKCRKWGAEMFKGPTGSGILAWWALSFPYGIWQLQDFFCPVSNFKIGNYQATDIFLSLAGSWAKLQHQGTVCSQNPLYGTAPAVRRQEISLLLERDFLFFCINRRPTPNTKKKPASGRRLKGKCHQKPVWWERLLVPH